MDQIQSKYDGATKIWHGPQIPYRYPMDVMFGDILLEKLMKSPNRILQICADDESTLSCEQLRISSIRVAQHLQKIGIQEDDVVGLITHHSHFATCFITGCIVVGAIVNPLDGQMSENDMRHVFNESKPKVIICDDEAIPKLQKALQLVDFNYRIYSATKGSSNFYLKAENFLRPTGDESNFKIPKFSKPSDQKLFAILCSSGTTGMPKSVCLTHASIIDAVSFYSLISFSKPSKSLSFSPLYWVSGFSAHISVSFLESEVRILTGRKFSVDTFIEIAEAYQITNVTMAPYVLNTLLNSQKFLSSNITSLQNIMLVGAIFSEEARKKFDEVLPNRNLTIAYGMTEQAATATKPFEYRKGLSVGSIILPNVSIKIINDDGIALDNGFTGEICAKSKFKFLVSVNRCYESLTNILTFRAIITIQKPLNNSSTMMVLLKLEMLDISMMTECCL